MQPRPDSGFTERFVRLNDLQKRGFTAWSFQPGMLFGAREKWWGEHGGRQLHHEGIDIATFLDGHSEQRLDTGMLVPPLFNGQVVNIIDDLLGRTVIVDHAISNPDSLVLHAFYAHITPHQAVCRGAIIEADGTLGSIAPGSTSPAHLHISTAWVARDMPLSEFSWETSTLQFFDPLEII